LGPAPIFYFLRAISVSLAVALFVTVPLESFANIPVVATIVAAPSTGSA